MVESLDIKTKNVAAKKVSVSYFTRPKTDKETDIIEVTGSKPVGNFIIRKGHVKVTEHITHFEKRKVKGQELLSTHHLRLPPIIYETVGFWIEIESEIEKSVIKMGMHFMGGIHAVEHALISMFPLFALCDRDDIGGISTTFHHQVKKGAVFIYDGYPGGVGLAERGYEFIEKLLSSTLKLITSCNCDIGCPSCIHSPKCGSGNKPLDKVASIAISERLLDIKPISNGSVADSKKTDSYNIGKKVKQKKQIPKKRICYFDIETQRGASEVGGWNNVHLMKLAVGVVYDSLDNKYHSYLEKNVNDLIEKLFTADLVVGFNIIRFDYQVLQPYTVRDMKKNKTFDILADIHSRLGYRLSLNHIAMKTLNVEKSADGLQSLKWFKEGRLDEVISYCNKDVEITRDIFLYGKKNGHILFEKDGCGIVKLPVKWDIENIIKGLRPAE